MGAILSRFNWPENRPAGHGRVPWERQWTEPLVEALARKLSTIVKQLESEAPNIAKRYEEAQPQAEIEQQQWLAECRERERREREQRRAASVKASREQLLAIIDEWALARRVEWLFEDAGFFMSRQPPSEASAVNARLERARQLLGGVDSPRRFGAWRCYLSRYSAAGFSRSFLTG